MTFKRTYERWGFKDGEGKLRRRIAQEPKTIAPGDDDDRGSFTLRMILG
jgi:hypothetical protein